MHRHVRAGGWGWLQFKRNRQRKRQSEPRFENHLLAPLAPAESGLLSRYRSPTHCASRFCEVEPNFRSDVLVSRCTGTDPVPSDCGDMEKKAKSIGVMTSDQAIQLRQLAFDAYEPDAFRPNLTRTEAERCIAALQAKLRLMDDPPHVQ